MINLDLGHGHSLEYVSWTPDRELNPQWADFPDIEKLGANIEHTNSKGQPCVGFITFASDIQRHIFPNRITWDVENWEPLSIHPSVLCSCGDHGFIKEGRWVVA